MSPSKTFQAALAPRSRARVVGAQRQRLMLQIAALQRSGQRSKFIANAEQLLTRWWATVSWSTRSDLLKTAQWLLRAEARLAATMNIASLPGAGPTFGSPEIWGSRRSPS